MLSYDYEIEYKEGEEYKYLEVHFEFRIVTVESNYGEKCPDVDEIDWDKSKYSPAENQRIAYYLEENEVEIIEKILEYYCRKD